MSEESNLNNKVLRKSLVYGASYLSRIVGNLCQYGLEKVPDEGGLNLGYPGAALGFAALDIIAENLDPVKQSGYYKLAKIGGAATFSALALSNFIGAIKGDYEGIKNLPFNLSMAASLGYDLKEPGKDFLKKWDWTFGLNKK